MAAVTAVTAIGASLRDALLAPEADRAVASPAGFQINLDLVDEHERFREKTSPASRKTRNRDRADER